MPKKEWIEGRRALLEWFGSNQRDLPWRAEPDPYAVWLCEIIMQQTRIEQGIGYWNRFLTTWPSVHDLANAALDDVLKAWQGLGYYSRARNLHRAAKIIAQDCGGRFPENAAGWLAMPGVGPYTAAAIASICMGEAVAAVDGNVLRVLSRYLDVMEPIDRPQGRKQIDQFASEWLDSDRPGDHNQAVMELGALICSPRNPQCADCPLANSCRSVQRAPGTTPAPPIKAGKTRVERVAVTFHVVTDGENVWMRERPQQGIWGGLWEFPSVIEGADFASKEPVPPHDLTSGLIRSVAWGSVFEHVLSHRRMQCRFWVWQVHPGFQPDAGVWIDWETARSLPIPRAIDRFWPALEKSQSRKAAS